MHSATPSTHVALLFIRVALLFIRVALLVMHSSSLPCFIPILVSLLFTFRFYLSLCITPILPRATHPRCASPIVAVQVKAVAVRIKAFLRIIHVATIPSIPTCTLLSYSHSTSGMPPFRAQRRYSASLYHRQLPSYCTVLSAALQAADHTPDPLSRPLDIWVRCVVFYLASALYL